MKRHDRMKKRGISTLSVHRMLKENGIVISKRSLHHWLETDMIDVKSEQATLLIDHLIKRYDQLGEEVKNLLKSEGVPS